MTFCELVDIAELQALCESFSTLTGAVTAILDLEGNILVATGWQEICTRFHRVHPSTAYRCRESDTVLAGRLGKGERYNVYKCKNGLVDVAVPIIIGGEHVANFFTGQFFFDAPDRESFIHQAEEFGFDKDAYLTALGKVPIFSDFQVRAMMVFFARLAQLIGEMGVSRKSLEEANTELHKHRELLEELVEKRTAELLEATRVAETANRAKSVFLANMSHELRTPLNAVLGFAQLMKNSRGITAEQMENLNIITQSADHLLNLINNVLDISKIEAGRIEIKETYINLRQLLVEMESLMFARAVERGLDFTVQQSPDLPLHIATDAVKLRQVLINLIGNAVKYTRNGGVILRAGVMNEEASGRLWLGFDVEDTGPGIREEDRERIFSPFVQLGDRPSSEAGAGLGLAICRQYVELMGGTINVAGEPGRGSVFHFEIPVAVIPHESTPDAARKGRVLGLEEGQPHHRLLIADDHPDNRLLLHRLLERLGFDLLEATNGKEVVTLSEEWRPHLIFMDIRMPVLNGWDATRLIKSTNAGVKVVALTAHAFEDERNEILANGFDDYIRKPYEYYEIIDALTRHLGVRFVYEEETAPTAVAARPDVWAMASLPHVFLDALEEALTLLDVAAVSRVIEEIRTHNSSLADMLAAVAKDLQYGRILRLIQTARGETGPECCQ